MSTRERRRFFSGGLGAGFGLGGGVKIVRMSRPSRRPRTQPSLHEGRLDDPDSPSRDGVGWIITAKSSGKEYISLTLADPQIGPRRIYANLAPVKGRKGRYALLWNPGE